MSDDKPKARRNGASPWAWLAIATISIAMMLLGYSCECNGWECSPPGHVESER